MGEVEIFINEEGALKVVQHYDLSVMHRRPRPEGLERPRVFKWPNCSCWSTNVQDAEFNRVLKVFFLITLGWAGISFLIFYRTTHRRPLNESSTWDNILQMVLLGVVPLALFAAVLAVCVPVEKATESAGSAPPRREEVQTISALLQQV